MAVLTSPNKDDNSTVLIEPNKDDNSKVLTELNKADNSHSSDTCIHILVRR